MPSLLDLMMGTRGGWNPDVPQEGVRPGYGLETATGIGRPVRSEYQRTLDPGETRSPESLQAMLAEVILAAGSGALPGVGPKVPAKQAPGMRSISATHPQEISVKQLRGELKGGSLDWSPTPSPKPWTIRYPDGTAFKRFENPTMALEWLAKNKIELQQGIDR